jgi:hypothetical protein
LLKRDRWRKAVSAINALAIVEGMQKETHLPIVITNRATERVLTVEELMRALAVNAARGQLRSQQVFTKLLAETERAHSPVAKGAARVDALRKSHGIDCASAFSTHPRG